MATVLITGTSTGIGMETALAFGRAGHRVAATMRNPSAAPKLAEAAAREKLPVSVVPMDVDADASVLDGMARSGDGTTVAEADRASLKAMAEQAEQAATAAEANPALSPEIKQQLRDAAKRAREEADRGVEMTKALDVPPANLALFKKHREEILKYTMGGLELIPF